MARRALPTPGSTTARCTVPGCKNGVAASRARPPARMSWRGTSWVRSASRADGQMDSSTPFMIPTKGSRSPKSVVRVIRPGMDLRGAGEGLAVAIDDEIRDQDQRLLVLRVREGPERVLRALSVLVGPLERVLHARVLAHEPADLLDLLGGERGLLEHGVDPVSVGRPRSLDGGDQGQRALAFLQVGADRLPEPRLVRDEVERAGRSEERRVGKECR